MSNENGSYSARNGKLPVLYVPAEAKRAPERVDLPASFTSQLLASRQHMRLQPMRRMTPDTLAAEAYTKGSRIAVKRMPNGYVRTLVV